MYVPLCLILYCISIVILMCVLLAFQRWRRKVKELNIIKDWASDGLVLQLLLVDTISKILDLKGPQYEQIRALTLLKLFFHRAYLAAVNMKDVIDPECH